MNLCNCPRCHEPFRLPAQSLPQDAYAECPWCRETVTLGEVLATLPPVAKVISSAGQVIETPQESVDVLGTLSSTGIGAGAGGIGAGGIGAGGIGAGGIGAGAVTTGKIAVGALGAIAGTGAAALGVDAMGAHFKGAELDTDDEGETIGVGETLVAPNETEIDQHDFETVIEESNAEGLMFLESGEGSSPDELHGTLSEHENTKDSWNEGPTGAIGVEIDHTDLNEDELDEEDGSEFLQDDDLEMTGSVGGASVELVDDAVQDGSWPVDAGAAVTEEVIAPMRVTPKPTRKKGSPIRTLLGTVAGGVIAVPLAAGILWFANVDMGFWPLDGSRGGAAESGAVAAAPMEIADHSSRSVPDSEPLDLPKAPAFDPNADSVPSSAETALNEITADSGGEFAHSPPMSDAEISASGFNPDPSASASETFSANDPASIAEPERLESTSPEPAAPAPDQNDFPMPDSLAGLSDSVGASESEVSIVPIEDLGMPAAESAASPKLKAAVEEATDLLAAATKLKKMSKDRAGALTKAYSRISDVGDLGGDGKIVKELLQRIKDSNALNEFEKVGPKWISYSKRSSDGILLVGEISGSGQTIRCESGDEFPVSGSIDAGKKVIAVGRIVGSTDNPSIEISAAEAY